MKTLTLVIVEEKLPKGVLVFILIAVLLLAGLSNSCAIAQYSENVRKVLPATVRIIAVDSMGSGVAVGNWAKANGLKLPGFPPSCAPGSSPFYIQIVSYR